MQGVYDIPALRDNAPVFRDRSHAGAVLADLLDTLRQSDAIVLAIPAGGVPVAAEVAKRLAAPLEVAVVSKILLPWTTEAGYGAIAWDGSLWVNEEDARYYHLTEEQIAAGVAEARVKVQRRCARLRGNRPMPALAGCTAILVDDGIAAGSTMRAAIGALRRLGAGRIIAAAPTGHERSVRALAELADAVCCANLRGGSRYAVADAYEQWRDVTEDEAAQTLARFIATTR